MLDQARHFATLAPNVQVKFPVTAAGLRAIEQATYEGISINATVSFTLPQALAVGEPPWSAHSGVARPRGRMSRACRRCAP